MVRANGRDVGQGGFIHIGDGRGFALCLRLSVLISTKIGEQDGSDTSALGFGTGRRFGMVLDFESIFLIEFKEKRPLMMIISVESLVDARFQIFYKRIGHVYNEEDSQFFPVFEGDNNIFIRIPYSEDLESIRIDPIDKNQNCIIEKIELYYVEE